MTFMCRQCGRCCMFLGDYIAIEEQIGPYEFRCESVSTGTPFTAAVDEDKREIFADRSFPDEHPHACRFLRPDGNLVRCTIHRDSPAQCKSYRCVVMRVYDPGGREAGYVTGTLALHSDDPDLRSVWTAAEKLISPLAPDAEARFGEFLEKEGYRIE
jgi:Fe-S-cluster containining protein